jgi:hypothetical protein
VRLYEIIRALMAEYSVPKIKYKGTPVDQVIRSTLAPEQPEAAGRLKKDETSVEFLERIEMEKSAGNPEPVKSSLIEELDDGEHAPAVKCPKHQILYRGHIEMQEFTNSRDKLDANRPKEIVVKIDLPGVPYTLVKSRDIHFRFVLPMSFWIRTNVI